MISHIESAVLNRPDGVAIKGVSTRRISMSVPVIPAIFLTWNSLRMVAELIPWYYLNDIREKLYRADLWETVVGPFVERFDLTPRELYKHDARYRLTQLERAMLVSRAVVDVEHLNRNGHMTTCPSPPCSKSGLRVIDALLEAFKSSFVDTRGVFLVRRHRRKHRPGELGFGPDLLWTSELTGESTLATLAWYFSRNDVKSGSEVFHEVSHGGCSVLFMFPVITGLRDESVGRKYCQRLSNHVLRFLSFLRRAVEAFAISQASSVFTE